VLASAFEGILTWDAAAARCKVSTHYTAFTCPQENVVRFRELCPYPVHGQVVGSGYFVPMEIPEAVADVVMAHLV
jgi:hypothetical protein